MRPPSKMLLAAGSPGYQPVSEAGTPSTRRATVELEDLEGSPLTSCPTNSVKVSVAFGSEQPLINNSPTNMRRMGTSLSVTHPEAGCVQQLNWGRVGCKIAAMVGGGLILAIALEEFAGKEVQKVSEKVMDAIGLPGLFFAVFLMDGVPQPFTYVPLIFLAVKDGSTSKPTVFAICAAASYCAAITGYMIGRKIRNFSQGKVLFESLGKNYPYVPDMMERRGAIGVALAALLPCPLAIATWTAGSFEVPFWHFALAGMCRMPKILIAILLSSASMRSK